MPARTWLMALLLAVLPLAPAVEAAPPTPGVSPSDPRNFTWIVPGVLAVGGGGLTKDQVDWLHGEGFRAIANFRAEHKDPEAHIRAKGMAFLDLPIDHAVHMNVTQLKEFIAWAKEQQAAGRPMYIHCTNGWHRAATFAVAWEMERAGGELTFDEAGKNASQRRPGTVMRAPGPLLAFEAELSGKAPLSVMMISNLSRPEWGGTMPVTVQVLTAKGEPAEGASVKVWSEESGLRITGKTGEDGRFVFTYKSPPHGTSMDHLYARASYPGHVDGADNVELFYHNPVRPGPVQVEATWTPQGIDVEIRKNGVLAYSHAYATASGGWMVREMANHGQFRLPLPEPARPVTIHVERWGAEPAKLVVQPGETPASPPPKAKPDAPAAKQPPSKQQPPAEQPPRGVLEANEVEPSGTWTPPPIIANMPPASAHVQQPPTDQGASSGSDAPAGKAWERSRWGLALLVGGTLLALAGILVMHRKRGTHG